MSKLSQLRKAMGYETNTPRCETCKNAKKPYVYLTTNSVPRKSPWFCKVGDFSVAVNACCDQWAGKDGSTLDDR